jgi:hypothetical protein
MIDEDAFGAELDRLVDGLATKPIQEAQRAAIYDAVVRPGRLTAQDWHRVVDLALASGRWPTVDQWDKFIERAHSQARGPRATAERRCECGGTFEPRGQYGWIFLGTGSQPRGTAAPRDRVDHPDRWVPTAEYGCTGCRVAGFLLQDEAHHQVTGGRRYRSGDFVVAKSVRPRGPKPSAAVAAAERAYQYDLDRATEYQEARRLLLGRMVREHMPLRRMADALLELIDRFPEKGPALVAEAAVLVDSGPRSARSSALEPEGFIPATPTLRDARIAECDHRRVRGQDPVLCADCGAELAFDGWSGGSLDSLRWPWTASGAARWWASHRRGGRIGDPVHAGTSDASPATPVSRGTPEELPAGDQAPPDPAGEAPPGHDPGVVRGDLWTEGDSASWGPPGASDDEEPDDDVF